MIRKITTALVGAAALVLSTVSCKHQPLEELKKTKVTVNFDMSKAVIGTPANMAVYFIPEKAKWAEVYSLTTAGGVISVNPGEYRIIAVSVGDNYAVRNQKNWDSFEIYAVDGEEKNTVKNPVSILCAREAKPQRVIIGKDNKITLIPEFIGQVVNINLKNLHLEKARQVKGKIVGAYSSYFPNIGRSSSVSTIVDTLKFDAVAGTASGKILTFGVPDKAKAKLIVSVAVNPDGRKGKPENDTVIEGETGIDPGVWPKPNPDGGTTPGTGTIEKDGNNDLPKLNEDLKKFTPIDVTLNIDWSKAATANPSGMNAYFIPVNPSDKIKTLFYEVPKGGGNVKLLATDYRVVVFNKDARVEAVSTSAWDTFEVKAAETKAVAGNKLWLARLENAQKIESAPGQSITVSPELTGELVKVYVRKFNLAKVKEAKAKISGINTSYSPATGKAINKAYVTGVMEIDRTAGNTLLSTEIMTFGAPDKNATELTVKMLYNTESLTGDSKYDHEVEGTAKVAPTVWNDGAIAGTNIIDIVGPAAFPKLYLGSKVGFNPTIEDLNEIYKDLTGENPTQFGGMSIKDFNDKDMELNGVEQKRNTEFGGMSMGNMNDKVKELNGVEQNKTTEMGSFGLETLVEKSENLDLK